MKIVFPIIFNIIAVTAFYLLDKKTAFASLGKMTKQLIYGLVFGVIAISGTELGWGISGAVINVRDSAPLCAGLIFGWQAGIIAGAIGGIYRAFAVLWGVGEYTVLACSISTVIAGIVAALLRKFMFDDKKPTWAYAFGITVVMEIFHMLMIFITNITDPTTAFHFVQICTLPMTLLNAFTVSMCVLIVTILSKEKKATGRGNEQIAQTFQRWLVICILIAFAITSFFTYYLQTDMRSSQIEETFTSTINDVAMDISGKSDYTMTQTAKEAKKVYLNGECATLDELAKNIGVDEINLINKNGMIIDSTVDEYINSFDMNSTEQSRQFMVLADCDTEQTFVQPFGPVGINQNILRKYAGISLDGGGFLQVGYNQAQFYENLNGFVIDFTKNRHVGVSGFVAVCDEELLLVTDDEVYSQKPVSAIGIQPNSEMENGLPSSQIYKTTIVNEETNYESNYLYVFAFVERYCVIVTIPEAEAMLIRDASAYLSIFMQMLMFAGLFVLLYFLIKKLVIDNIHKINHTLSKISNGNLNETVDVRSNVEFASLSDDINSTVNTLKRYINEAAARIDKELEYAKQIQLSALPSNFPCNQDYEIYAQMIAAKEVGGDFYDFYKLSDNTLAFLVADVSGKGIPAAMFMMTAKTIIKDLAERGLEVNQILTEANAKLCENNESGMFVTAWMGILDVDSGVLSYANAGHNPPLICKNGKFEYLKSRPGFVLAGMEGVRYKINQLTLEKGDRILLYTDGVTEATDVSNHLYGEDRLYDFTNNNVDLSATAMLPSLKSDIDLFVGKAPQFDDITMLIFDYKKQPTISDSRVFPAKVDCLDQVLQFVEEWLERCDCPMKHTMALSVAIEEVFVNVAKYAYAEDGGDVTLTVSFDSQESQLTFEMVDKGKPFNPLDKPDPDVTLSADQRQIGGLGIYITKKTMDKVSYRYENGENILTMKKTI